MDESILSQSSVLRFSEELVLLLLDKDTGLLSPVPERSLRRALAGAVLMDLALENRIDTDLDTLLLVDPNPVGDDLLDPYLKQISQSADSRDTAYWIDCLAKPAYADQVYQDTLNCLIERGIVEREGEGMLSVANRVVRSRRYPHLDGEAGREVELRIMSALFSEEIPSPRDVMLIALVDACGIFERLLSPSEMVEVRDRLKLIGKMDLIARTVFAAIRKAGVPDARSVPGVQSNIASKAARTRALAAIPLADGGGLPIAGNAFRMMGKNLIYYLAQQYRELGPVFRLRAFRRKFIVLAGPEANQFLQRKGRLHLRNHDLFYGTARALGAHRIISSVDGAEHLRFRKMFRNGYSRKYFLDRIDDAAGVVARELDTLPQRTPMPALPILRRMIGKQIGQLCIGFQGDEYLGGLVEYFGRIVDVLASDRPKFMLRTPRMRRLYTRLETLCHHIIELHENAPQNLRGEGDLIDDILALHRADPQFLPETDLLSACVSPFFVGLHTVANAATLMLYALLKHPEVMERMLPEVETLFANEGPTVQKLRTMEVTHRIAMETLRMYRIAPVSFRTVVNAFEFAGHVIPAGTSAMFATTMMHVMPEYFPEPERFDIDRYLPGCVEHKKPGAYAPFGLGIHRCLGSGFTEVCLALTLATMLHHTKITMHPSNYQVQMNLSTIAVPRNSFKIVVSPRN